MFDAARVRAILTRQTSRPRGVQPPQEPPRDPARREKLRRAGSLFEAPWPAIPHSASRRSSCSSTPTPASRSPATRPSPATPPARGVELQLELTSCQVETATEVANTSEQLRAELTRLRRIAAEAAEADGARLLAVGLPPTVPHEFPITDNPRYRQIAERFGMIAHEQGICGCHVHVEVPDRDAAIRVSNRLRPWLPLLLALTANSAVYRNTDTGYASWRSILWQRWPSAGPPPHFESADEYDAVVRDAAGQRARCWTTGWSIGTSARRPTSRRSRCASPTSPPPWPRRCCWRR